jgi:O-antigen ligase
MRVFGAQTACPRVCVVLQAVGFVTLTGLLIQIISGDSGIFFLMSLLGGVCVLWIFKEPHWGVLIIISMWFLRFSPTLLGVSYLRIPYLLSAILLIPLAVSILRDREIWVWRVPQIKILVAIGILLLASTGWSFYQHPVGLLPELDQTGEMLQIFLVRLIFLVFFLYFITSYRKIELFIWVLLGLIIASAMSALYHLTEPGSSRAWAAFGPGTNPTSLPFLCLFGASLLWFYYSRAQSGYRRRLALLCLVPLPTIALASGSRGGVLQLLTFAALIIKEQEGWSAAKKVRSLLLLGAISLLFLSIVPAASLLRATSFEATQSTGAGESLSNRISTVTAAFEMIASNPVLGIGIGNFRWLHQIGYGSDLHPHNSYVGALLNGGIACLALYLLLFYFTYQMLKELEKSGPRELLWVSKGLRINLILFLIASISDDIWLNDFLYLMIGLTVAMTCVWQSHYQRFIGDRSSFNHAQGNRGLVVDGLRRVEKRF